MELKPCPFCGGEAELVPHKFFSEKFKVWKVESYGIECYNCHAKCFPFFEREEDAIKAWNRRVDNGEI